MGVFAEFERSMIRERVNAGIARAKVDRKHFGRPSMPSLRIASARLWLRLVPSQDRQAVRRRQRHGSTDRGRQLGGAAGVDQTAPTASAESQRGILSRKQQRPPISWRPLRGISILVSGMNLATMPSTKLVVPMRILCDRFRRSLSHPLIRVPLFARRPGLLHGALHRAAAPSRPAAGRAKLWSCAICPPRTWRLVLLLLRGRERQRPRQRRHTDRPKRSVDGRHVSRFALREYLTLISRHGRRPRHAAPGDQGGSPERWEGTGCKETLKSASGGVGFQKHRLRLCFREVFDSVTVQGDGPPHTTCRTTE